ncbi:hypothetical protein MHU86_19247 [Fragilaria crotonensis]|nr:hypothetical protein MHU86_19247 [Fragilaria crotonensis]
MDHEHPGLPWCLRAFPNRQYCGNWDFLHGGQIVTEEEYVDLLTGPELKYCHIGAGAGGIDMQINGGLGKTEAIGTVAMIAPFVCFGNVTDLHPPHGSRLRQLRLRPGFLLLIVRGRAGAL